MMLTINTRSLASWAMLVALTLNAIVAPETARAQTIPETFKKLDKSTTWRSVEEISLNFRTYHPQGMVIIGDRIIFSSVHALSRIANTGTGYLFETDRKGNLVKQIEMGEDKIYHPGGIDYDGKNIWVPLAEYRPNSSSIVYRVHAQTFEVQEVFRFADHLGALIFNPQDNTLHAVSWGSRKFYTWKINDALGIENPDGPEVVLNGNQYIDYQDCHYVGGGYALCGGLNRYTIAQKPPLHFALGGLDLINLKTNRAVHQLAVTQWVRPRLVMTNNPFHVELREKGLRFYFMPEDDNSTIYIYDPR